jgi:hypothetical protein
MGHYDNCRDGYCARCGAAPGNIKDGKCEFCFPEVNRKTQNKDYGREDFNSPPTNRELSERIKELEKVIKEMKDEKKN